MLSIPRLYEESDLLRNLYCRTFGRFRPSIMRHPPYAPEVARSIWNSQDPVRYAFLAAAVKRLDEENVRGDMAELGVYRGDTSRFLHALAPDRTLHLFDTFQGFSRQDTNLRWFKNTNIEIVKRRLGDLRKIELHAGYFPQTTQGLEEQRFALVMLDADVYNPIRAGLEFFYPRTVPGGYIFVHDYNSRTFNYDAKRATDEFMRDKPELLLDMPDRFGTVLIRKLQDGQFPGRK